MTPKLYFVRIAKIDINSFSLEILDPIKVNVNIFFTFGYMQTISF